MPEDPLDLAELRRIAAGNFAGVLDQAPASFDGEDETGAVRVVVDQSGTVTEVRVVRGWHRKMHRNDLGAAVLAAITVAGGKAMVADAERIVAAVNASSGSPAAATDRSPVAFTPDLGVVKRALYLVDRVKGEQAAVERNATPGRTTGASSGGHVRVRFSGTRVVGVQVDDETNWTVVASPSEIESEITDALRNGYAAAAARNVEQTDATTELLALTADPRSFADELFGARRNGG